MSEAERLAELFYAVEPRGPDGALRVRPRAVVWTACAFGGLAVGLAAASALAGDAVAAWLAPAAAAAVVWAASLTYRGRAAGWTGLAFATVVAGLSLTRLLYESLVRGGGDLPLRLAAAVACAAAATLLVLPQVRAWCGCLREGRPRVRLSRTARPLVAQVYGVAGLLFGGGLCAMMMLAVSETGRPPSFSMVIAGPLLFAGGVGVLLGWRRGWMAYAAAVGLGVIGAVRMLVSAYRMDGDPGSYAALTAIPALALAGLYLPGVRAWCGVRHVNVRWTALVWSVIVGVLVVTG